MPSSSLVVAIHAFIISNVVVNAFTLSKMGCSTLGFKTALKSTADDLSGLQNTLFDTVNADLGLKLTSFTETYEANEWKQGEWSGTTGWWDESKGSKLTGVSKNSVRGPGGQSSETLNIWMGPGYTVPHMMLTIASDPQSYEGISINADYLVRGPTPIGNDMNYVDSFYGKEVIDWYDNIVRLPNARNLPPSSSFSARLLASPVHIAVGGLNLEEASSASTEHVTRWLRWLRDAKAVEARQRGAMNSRDDKQRQFAYRAAVAESTAKIGKELGQIVGACSTGPVSEAYIGGGS